MLCLKYLLCDHKVLPIFYKVTTSNVKQLKGEFGDHFRDREWEYRFDKPRIERWKEALAFISGKLGLTFDDTRYCNPLPKSILN